jgi:hypothetical protein
LDGHDFPLIDRTRLWPASRARTGTICSPEGRRNVRGKEGTASGQAELAAAEAELSDEPEPFESEPESEPEPEPDESEPDESELDEPLSLFDAAAVLVELFDERESVL